MISAALKQTRQGTRAIKETALSEFLPYSRHVDDETISTKDGYVFQVIKLDGFAFETADQSQINHLKRVRNTLLMGLASSRFALNYHIVRREVFDYPEPRFSGFCAVLDNTWKRKLSEKHLFVNDQYITVIRRNLTGTAGIAERLGRLVSSTADRAAEEAQQRASIKALYEATDNLIGTLEKYGARRLGVYETPTGPNSEILEFLSYLLNQEMRPVKLPRAPLDSYLPYKRPLFGNEAMEIRGAATGDSVFASMLSIKEYGPVSGAGMLDDLLRLPHEMIISQSFAFVDRLEASKRLRRTARIMDNAEDDAVSLREDLGNALDDLSSGRIQFGEHPLSCLVKGRDQTTLDRAVTDTLSGLTDLGLIAVREDLNLEACFWAQMPGNFAFIARKSEISTRNFAGYASFHNYPQGKLSGNLNFHHLDLGNFTVIGPSGTGKTVVLCFLMAQAQRFDPFSIFFDKDRGAEIFIRAIGGHYSVIQPGHSTGFNPLQLEDTPRNRDFLRSWLAELGKPRDGSVLSSSDLAVIADAVEENFGVPPEQRRLSVLRELFHGHERQETESLAARLRQWWGDGERAWLFDNETDQLQFDTRTTGFDLTYILDDDISRPAALMYLAHRVDQTLDAHESNQRTIIFFDEAWKGLKDPYVSEQIENWERTIRKRGGLVGLGSQSATSIADSPIGDVIIEMSPTQIFMPNHKADKATYCERFGLTEEEFRWIRDLGDTSRCFLVKHGTHSVIARLDLSGEDDLLAVLSGRSETVNLLDTIRAEVGDNPNSWMPEFQKRRSL